MTPNEIKGALIARYGTLRHAARILGVESAELSHTIHMRREYPKIRSLIARALGRDVRQVFPPFHKQAARAA